MCNMGEEDNPYKLDETWQLTGELRWLRRVDSAPLTLQQRWVSFAGAEVWRDVPQVLDR